MSEPNDKSAEVNGGALAVQGGGQNGAAPEDQPKTQVAKREKPQTPERLIVTSDIALMDSASFDHMQRIATLMSKMDLLPLHLRSRPWFYPKKKTDNLSPAEEQKWREQLGPEGWERAWAEANQHTIANCILVVDQALRWGMNPFSTMGETYEVGGKLGNQGKLVAAVVNSRAGLKERLRYEFEGAGLELTVTVIGTFKGEDAPRTVQLSVKNAKTDNQMWIKDPEQKLIYSGVVKWARRHCPEIILGIMTDDDFDAMAQEQAARGPQQTPSQLDAFAGGRSAPALAAAPAEVIDVTAAGKPETVSVTTAPAPPESDGQAPPAPEAAPAAPQEQPAGARPKLAIASAGKLRASLRQEPAVDEVAFSRRVDPRAGEEEGRSLAGAESLSSIEGEPGETAASLYNRALVVLQAMRVEILGGE